MAINTGMDYKISLIDDDANLCFEIPDSLKNKVIGSFQIMKHPD